MQFVLLALGLAMIVKSADVLIDSASKIARRYGVSSFIIGITVIAFGTSAPELAVGIVSGIDHTNQLTLGNIIGSSMSNMALIIGLSAIIFPLQVKDNILKRELPILFAIQIGLGVMMFMDGLLSKTEGLILMGLFVVFMVYISMSSKQSMKIQIDAEGDIDTDGDGNGLLGQPEEKQKKTELLKLWCFSLLSLLGLFIGGRLTVDASTKIAQSLGLSETLIGLTVVALATTMPELITSIVAARKKEHEIVLGNCIGSNIFNILLVLGVSSTISPIAVEERLKFDVASMLFLTVVIFVMSLLRKKLQRRTGVFLLMGYILYLAIKVFSAIS
ncbi:MAG TPA: calcium/sodium antiporter [Clostridia bacterium]|nr:calcium/sodium antiporter [Clostridia bacterium]